MAAQRRKSCPLSANFMVPLLFHMVIYGFHTIYDLTPIQIIDRLIDFFHHPRGSWRIGAHGIAPAIQLRIFLNCW